MIPMNTHELLNSQLEPFGARPLGHYFYRPFNDLAKIKFDALRRELPAILITPIDSV
jgi:hypothetical protein